MEIVIGALLIGLVLAFATFAGTAILRTRHWRSTVATISRRTSIGEEQTYKYVLRYNVEGRSFENSPKYGILSGRALNVGDETTVLYNPRKHDEIAWFDQGDAFHLKAFLILRLLRLAPR